MMMQPYKFTCFTCWIYFSKIESIFAFGIIYYDNTVPADDLTTHKKASAGVNLTYFSQNIQSNLTTRNQETVNWLTLTFMSFPYIDMTQVV